MKSWMTLAIIIGWTLGCGQDEQRRSPGHLDHVEPATALTSSNSQSPNLRCFGPGLLDHRYFNVFGFKDAHEKYVRTQLQRLETPTDANPEALGDYTFYQDISPRQPTDILFRFLFSEPLPLDHGFSVNLMEGGFTMQATVEIKEHHGDADEVVASLTCRRLSTSAE